MAVAVSGGIEEEGIEGIIVVGDIEDVGGEAIRRTKPCMMDMIEVIGLSPTGMGSLDT